MELISVIVPVYNAEKHLAECLDSILSQSYKNLEIILINDGSKDRSGDICSRYAERDGRIKLVNKPNGGVSAARNDGLALSKGDWVAFVDSDDCIACEFIEKLYNAAAGKAEISACCCVVRFDRSEFEEHFFEGSRLYMSDKRELYLQTIRENRCRPRREDYHASIGIAWGKLYKRGLIERGKLAFDVGLSQMEDTIFNLRAFFHASAVNYIDEALYFYRQSHRTELKSASYSESFDAIYGKVSEKMLDALEELSLTGDREIFEAYCEESLFRIADTLKKCLLNSRRKASLREKKDSLRELAARRANSLVIKNASLSAFKSIKIRALLLLLKLGAYTPAVLLYGLLQKLTGRRKG